MQNLVKSYISLLVVLIIGVLFISGCSSDSSKPVSENEPAEASQEQTEETEKETQKLEKLTIQAPMGISIAASMYKLVDDNNFDEFTNEFSYKPWKNPDELRARISGGQADVSAVPTYVGANLYNRGMDVKLINTLIWGILYVIGPDEGKIEMDQLKGETIYVPFKGDMPDLVFQYLLKNNDLDPSQDVNIQYVSSPQEVVKLLVSGKAKYAVVPEHVATLSVVKGKKEGKNLSKVMSLQEEWANVTGRSPLIPQAGILVNNQLIDEHPEVVEELQKQLKESVDYVNENPAEAAKVIQKYNEGVPAPIIEKVIPSLNLKFVSAKDAKEDLEFFFTELSTISPEIIGGKLPDEGFYYGK